MSLVQKTIKLVVATAVAIWLAQVFDLDYSSSAGVIALLSVLDTRQSSLAVAKERLLATLLALAFGSFLFVSLGFHLPVLILWLMIYLPTALKLDLERGIAPSTVLVLHVYQAKEVSLSLLGNELTLFGLGAGLALLVNLYMPSKQDQIDDYHILVEEKLKSIMRRFERFLLSGDGTNEGLLIDDLNQLLSQALKVVYQDRHNQLFNQTNYHVHYFEMRRAQTRLLSQMAKLINSLDESSAESVMLAQLFSETAQQISEKNSGEALMADIDAFLLAVRQRELPQTRSAFENRALLFQLLKDMRHFIQLKVDFYQDYEAILLEK